jgi:hypothetical protein
MARFSTLFLALLIASPALYATFVTYQLDLQTGLLRLRCVAGPWLLR